MSVTVGDLPIFSYHIARCSVQKHTHNAVLYYETSHNVFHLSATSPITEIIFPYKKLNRSNRGQIGDRSVTHENPISTFLRDRGPIGDV